MSAVAWQASWVLAPADTAFVVQAAPRDLGSWTSLARRLEDAGFHGLAVGDHPGLTQSPFVALGALASATSSIRLGTAVLNGGLREPLDIASDAATLAWLSSGRAILGLGAGHTSAEWTAVGRSCPSPAERVRRLAELAVLVRRLLLGEIVNHDGEWFTLRDARLKFAPADPIPLLIGGNGLGTLQVGAQIADVVEMGGLGKTLADEHFHEIRWRSQEIDRSVDKVRVAAGARPVELGALVQLVSVTDNAERVAAGFLDSARSRQLSETLPSVAELLASPFVLIGTIDEIIHQLGAAHRDWGISRYTVREPAADAIAEVILRLAEARPS
jgi:probable F420-dependent oxidoreductase